ncbi:MAG: carboxypeptidase-like regulatory domain-containing protein [Candidatus Eremiobacteraeota bacterium]|nr:carboxypeptidase-like regulatory domain-containing protein [Candidatus Eremiobacteraeota bacterium]
MQKRTKKIILFSVVILLLTSTYIYAGSSLFKVYVENRPVPVKTIVKGGEVYISLSDLSKIFPGEMKLDPGRKRLDIKISSPDMKDPYLSDNKKVPEHGISGNVSIKTNSGKEFFLKRVKITLCHYNKDVPDSVSLAQLGRFAAGDDDEYIGNHGKVREAVSNESGNFYITNAAPGKYELIAIYHLPGNKKGLFWRNIISVSKGKLTRVKFDSKNAYNF